MSADSTDTSDEWDPEPASLRDEETEDTGSHAQNTLALLKSSLESDDLDEETRERVRKRIDDAHEELDND